MAALECQSNVIFLGSSCDIIDFLIVWQNLCINYAQYLDSRVRYGYLAFFQVSYRFLVFSAILGIFFNDMEFLCNGSPEILSCLFLQVSGNPVKYVIV